MKDNSKFQPQEIEPKWQKIWEEKGIYQPDLANAKKPYYNLMMFPYPSAEGLHVGNVYAFTGVDINGRYRRMQGYDVFEPIGLDGFGIHSENYAIKIGKHPAVQAKISEKNFYRQLHQIGNGFAWKNKLETYDPDYYRWTQWIFVQMFKAGLAYRKKSPVNFCPSCKTVLSDEQVIDGACERCKSTVEKRAMEQWFFRITKYAERLLQNTYRKDFQWTEKVKIGQRNWIGKKEGINITYPVIDPSGQPVSGSDPMTDSITCFTTRPDTNFGATFVVIGPEHPFVTLILNNQHNSKSHKDTSGVARRDSPDGGGIRKAIIDYVSKSQKKSEADRIADSLPAGRQGRKKTGVFTGFYAVNQLNGYKMPIWISDFVLGNVGTGAVVGVPGHDMRDFEFAHQFNIPIIRVVVGKDGDKSEITRPEQVQEEEGKMINSGFLDGLEIHKAIEAMMDYIEKKGWGRRVVTYKLRDWCISRQRYWGAPIPMIYCPSCAKSGQDTSVKNDPGSLLRELDPGSKEDSSEVKGSDLMPGWFPVPEDQLPVLLPENVKDWKPEGTGKGPLAKIESFVNVKCLKCNGDAKRETDVCDTFLDSSWYHMRYPSVNQDVIPSPDSIGIEGSLSLSEKKNSHTREIPPRAPIESGLGRNDKSLPWDPEITKKWLPVTQYIGGAEHTVLHLLYSRFLTMALKDFGYLDFEEPFSRFYAHGLIIAEGAKMSKSKGNIVVPDAYIAKYGADALRTYLMFLGPFDHGGDFRDTGIAGMFRFLSRVWRLVTSSLKNTSDGETTPGVAVPSAVEGHDSPGVKESDNNLTRFTHRAIKEVTQDMENLRYNTAIAHIMEFVNFLTDSVKNTSDGVRMHSSEVKESVKTLLLLLAPFAPHMTEELWQALRHLGGGRQARSAHHDSPDGGGIGKDFSSIHVTPWPTFDPKFLVEDEVTIIVQVNGKTRDTIKVKTKDTSDGGPPAGGTPPRWRDQKAVEEIAKKSAKVQKYLSGQTIRKVIFVPGKLINFVV